MIQGNRMSIRWLLHTCHENQAQLQSFGRSLPNQTRILWRKRSLLNFQSNHRAAFGALYKVFVFTSIRAILLNCSAFILIPVTACTELKSGSCTNGNIDTTSVECSSDENIASGNPPPISNPPPIEILPGSGSPSLPDEEAAAPIASSPVLAFNFEGGFIPDAFAISGNSQISSERAFSGQNSVKFVSTGNGYNRNYITLDLSDTSFRERFFGRMMIYVVPPPENTRNYGGDFTFVEAEGRPQTNPNGISPPLDTNVLYRYRVAGDVRNHTLMANYDTWIDRDNNEESDWLTNCYQHSKTQIPRGQWTCVQWYFEKSSNQLRYWLYDQEIGDLYIQNSGEDCLGNIQNGIWTAPEAFEQLHLGLEQYYFDNAARTVYIDDVIIDDKFHSCP